ncbi:MAG: prephenate dehydratase [Lachnospiraceae bacterium]|jgi:chorismate mutase/prephenate dehydratase|nr:prephenate dehydratase [Lachnospiraceae bacterium]
MKELDLGLIRGELDEIDGRIIALFSERMELCKDVAEYKIRTGKPVFDPGREREKLDMVKAGAKDAFMARAREELFSQIMAISRRYQYQVIGEGKQAGGFSRVERLDTVGKRIVYQGMEGAYAHGAALEFFGKEANVSHVPTFEAAMAAVRDGEADYGVLPIENSSAGSVTDNYDLLIEYPNHIVGEVCIPVEHSLLALPGATLEGIRTVYSHPQALMQCSKYLALHGDWRQVSVENTALAAHGILTDDDETAAAIASPVAGELYGLATLATGINHNKNNTTRFIVVSRDAIYTAAASKITVCFELPHESGSLYGMLGNCVYNGANMVKIESRPIQGKTWEYRFFVDIEGNLGDESIRNALTAMEMEAGWFRVLGNY